MWTKNPVPNNCNGADCPFPPPMPGLYGHTHQTNTRMLEEINIVDKVKIPATLSLGKYTLSWRWDCEETTQVWLNCADVEIVCKTCDATPLPTPSPSPSPFPSPSPTVGGGACSSDTKDCSSTKCCSSPSRKCYRKDKYWAGCVEQCTPGQKQAADPPQYRTPWECKLLDESPPAPAPRPAPPSGGGGQPEPEPEEEPEAEPEAEDESESEGVCTANLGPKQACVPKKMKKYCTNANSKYHPWVMKNCCMACKAVLLELHARKPVGETKFSNRMVAQVDSHGALDID